MHTALDTRHHYRGMHGCPSHCRLRVYEAGPGEDGVGDEARTPVVLVTQCLDNPGTSVTNWVECLASEVWEMLGRPPAMVWVESYEGRPGTHSPLGDLFQRVEFAGAPSERDSHPSFSGPCWLPLSRREVEDLTGQPLAAVPQIYAP